MTSDFDIQSVRDEIDAEVLRKRHSGELAEDQERELDREFDCAPLPSAGPGPAVSGTTALADLLRRAARNAARLLIPALRKLR